MAVVRLGAWLTVAALGATSCTEKRPDSSTASPAQEVAPLTLPPEPVRIGYFYGGRTHALYRSYINGYFAREKVDVVLHTQFLGDDDWPPVPTRHEETRKLQVQRRPVGASLSRAWGKVTGIRIIDAMLAGKFQGGTPGESSFIQQIVRGSPVVAVAMLGFEDRQYPGKAIAVRTGVEIDGPASFRGKRFITRRAGAGDGMVLRAFLEAIGLGPGDVQISHQIQDPEQRILLRDGKADVALLHMHGVPQAEAEGIVWMYRKFDWLDPSISQALLVFRKDYVADHPEQVQRIVRGYMKRIKYEDELPLEEKQRDGEFGLQIVERYKGLSLPVTHFPCPVRIELLEKVQHLLRRYGFIDREVSIADFVDNRFVEKAARELGDAGR